MLLDGCRFPKTVSVPCRFGSRRRALTRYGKARHSLYPRALQIRADGEGTCVVLPQLGYRRFEIESTDVTEQKPTNVCVSCYLADETGRCMTTIAFRSGNGEVHDEDICALCKLDEPWVTSILIAAKYDGLILRLDSVRKGRDIWWRTAPVGYANRCHGRVLPSVRDRRLSLSGINHRHLKRNASPSRCAHPTTEYLKSTAFRIEEAPEKCREVWHHVVPSWACNCQRFFPTLWRPEKGRKVGDVVGM